MNGWILEGHVSLRLELYGFYTFGVRGDHVQSHKRNKCSVSIRDPKIAVA